MPDLDDATTGIQPGGFGGKPHGDFSGKDPATYPEVVRVQDGTVTRSSLESGSLVR